jgi:UDP-glucose 4-epimerase
MVIPNFVRQALAGAPITVHGDGSQRRCFTDVSDVVRALLGLIDHPDAIGEVFNVGSQQEISILDLAKKVKAKAKSASEIVFVPYEKAYEEGFEDMPRRIPDTSKIEKLVGFRPTVSLDAILERVIEHLSTS